MGFALRLIAIYLYTKFYFNANSNFKVICRTRYRMDGQTKRRLYASPFGEHKKELIIVYVYESQWQNSLKLPSIKTTIIIKSIRSHQCCHNVDRTQTFM